MKQEEPLISICIPLYEKDESLKILLESMEKHDAGIPYEICIGEAKQAACKNRNKAVKMAKSPYICQMDADVEIIQDGWLKKMYDTLKSNENIAITGCIIEYPSGKVDHPGTIIIRDKELIARNIEEFFPNFPEHVKAFLKDRVVGKAAVIPYEQNKEKIEGKIYEVFQCSGACFLYDTRKTGMFTEQYERAGWEDSELFARTGDMNLRIVVDGRVRVRHPSRERTKEEQALRNNESRRGFNTQNFIENIIRWRML